MWFIGYYKNFILGYAKIIKPLFGFTKKKQQIFVDFYMLGNIYNFKEMALGLG